MGLRSSPLSFWIPVLMLFPGAALGARIGGHAVGVITRALLVDGICLLDLGSAGAVDGNAIGMV